MCLGTLRWRPLCKLLLVRRFGDVEPCRQPEGRRHGGSWHKLGAALPGSVPVHGLYSPLQ